VDKNSNSSYHDLLCKSWFAVSPGPAVIDLVAEIDKSIEADNMDRAVSLMKAVDALGGDVELEDGEVIEKEFAADEDEEELDKGKRPTPGGQISSMDISGTKSAAAQTRHNMRKIEGGGWVKEQKPLPGDSINPDDTVMSRRGKRRRT